MQSAHSFERAHFSEKDGNWPDLRGAGESTEPPHFMTSWCHGAPGIGLSRIACSELINDAGLSAEVEAATETALNHSLADLDHLCCGNLGRLELLAWSASRDRRIHSQLALSLAQVVDGAKRRGGYRLFHHLPPGAWNPGFFRGTAGIGYSLLRQVAPGRLPNVMMLE
jgi:lantibiotic modifying enzyme